MMDSLYTLWNSVRAWLTEDKKTVRPWNFSVDTVVQSGIITYFPGANGFLFTNTGLTIVRVNNKILYPGVPGTRVGDSVAIAAHKNDVFKGIIKVVFDTGAGSELELVQVYYMDVQQR